MHALHGEHGTYYCNRYRYPPCTDAWWGKYNPSLPIHGVSEKLSEAPAPRHVPRSACGMCHAIPALLTVFEVKSTPLSPVEVMGKFIYPVGDSAHVIFVEALVFGCFRTTRRHSMCDFHTSVEFDDAI